MSFLIKQQQFEPAPEGVHKAVCVDVVDLGMVTSTFEGRTTTKHKCRIVWEIAATMQDGRRFLVSQTCTVSLHQKSSLRKLLKSWRGRDFSAEELEGFDLENVLSKPCQLVLVHNEVPDGRVFANIAAITKHIGPDAPLAPFGTYVRVKDRPPKEGQPGGGFEPDGPSPEETQEVPF